MAITEADVEQWWLWETDRRVAEEEAQGVYTTAVYGRHSYCQECGDVTRPWEFCCEFCNEKNYDEDGNFLDPEIEY
jgi:hypothetical protein